jgi:hypothetical protein
MKPDFSEFSYGYAVTEELVTKHKAALVAAPLFPSLQNEGKPGGGFDVKIPLSGSPVFLQFKLCECLERKNAKEYRNGTLGLPYYRMHLRPAKHSDQHKMLLALETSGEAVYYIAPEFHLPADLNAFYLSRSVVARSAAFSPNDIGSLPDDDEHYVAFERGAAVGFRCSEASLAVTKLNLSDGLRPVLLGRGIQPRELGEQGLRDLSERLLGLIIDHDLPLGPTQSRRDIDGLRRVVAQRTPIESVSYISRTFLDAECLIVE